MVFPLKQLGFNNLLAFPNLTIHFVCVLSVSSWIVFFAFQKQLLTLIETVWHLCEILFIETLPGKRRPVAVKQNVRIKW